MELTELAEWPMSDEYGNYFAIAVINALNRLQTEKMNEAAFCRRVNALAETVENCFSEYIGVFRSRNGEPGLCDLLIERDNPDGWRMRKRGEIPLCLSWEERVYLKAILQSRFSAIFFDEDEKKQLLERWADVPSVDLEKSCVFAKSEPETNRLTQQEIQALRQLLSAIRYQREITFQAVGQTGTNPPVKGFPVRIEYSVFDDSFCLLLLRGDTDEPVRVGISAMTGIAETGQAWRNPRPPQEIMKKSLADAPIEMRLRGKDFIFERALYSFSMYDTNIEKTGENEYFFRLKYYRFDLDEIIDKIMSFGPAIQVISPSEATDKIKERLSAWR